MHYKIFVILVSCYLSFLQYAFGLTGLQQPLNELGLTLDYTLANWTPDNSNARSPRNYCFSSHITFNEPISQIPVKHLWQMAFNAYSYIDADMSQYQFGKRFKKPGALTILAWGNEIILASSQKGSNSFTYQGEPSKVLQILQMCQTTYLKKHIDGTAKEHRTQGKCGEEMSAHLYYLLPTTKASNIDLPAQNAVIGTVGTDPRTGNVIKKDPCGPGSDFEWGCSFLVDNQGLTVLDRSIEPEDYVLEELAGGVASKDQVQLCGSLRNF